MMSEYGDPAEPRELFGRLVRQVWVEWAKEQPNQKPSWLLPWEELDDGQREVDMRIGAELFERGQRSAPEPAPRVFHDGEDVPPGVCVLHEDGEVGYLDDTGDCDCEEVERGDCEEHSYVNRNGNLGPLVEVILPDYEAALCVDRAARRAAG
jgi:hypothetical protein